MLSVDAVQLRVSDEVVIFEAARSPGAVGGWLSISVSKRSP